MLDKLSKVHGLSRGLEDTLLHVAGVSQAALFAWGRRQIWWLIKSQSAVLPYGKKDNLMKGGLAVYVQMSCFSRTFSYNYSCRYI